jgi:hypothetical protein
MNWTARRTLLAIALGALPAAGASANELSVLTAWYGQSCGTAHGNVTSHVKAVCDRRQTCNYRVDVNTLGDSAPGCGKNLIVLYSCAGDGNVHLAQLPAEASGSILQLSCVTNELRR